MALYDWKGECLATLGDLTAVSWDGSCGAIVASDMPSFRRDSAHVWCSIGGPIICFFIVYPCVHGVMIEFM